VWRQSGGRLLADDRMESGWVGVRYCESMGRGKGVAEGRRTNVVLERYVAHGCSAPEPGWLGSSYCTDKP
jgi:hypothetical protein